MDNCIDPNQRIEFLPETFVNELRSLDSSSELPSFSRFFAFLVDDEHYRYNLFKQWLKKLLIKWSTRLTESNLFTTTELSVTILFFIFLANTVRFEICDEYSKLMEAIQELGENDFSKYLNSGWWFLLKYYEAEKASTVTHNQSYIEKETLSEKFDESREQYLKFKEKIQVLHELAKESFSTHFHFQLFKQSIINEFRWHNHVGPHQLQLPKNFWNNKDKIKKKATSRVSFVGSELSLVDSLEKLQMEQKHYILPLQTSVNVDDRNWRVWFGAAVDEN